MTMVSVRGNPIEGRPIDWSGMVLSLPSDEIAIREGRLFILGLAPEVYFNPDHFPDEPNRIEVWEIRSNEMERVINDNELWYIFFGYYQWRTFKELYRYGARSFEEFREGTERFLKGSEWFEVRNRMRELRKDPEWWESMKRKLEALREMLDDDLTARGRKIGKISFMGIFEGDYEKLMGNKEEGKLGDIPYVMSEMWGKAIEEVLSEEEIEFIKSMFAIDRELEERMLGSNE